MEYTKNLEGNLVASETKTEIQKQIYRLEDLLLDEQNLLTALDKVRNLITEANKLGII